MGKDNNLKDSDAFSPNTQYKDSMFRDLFQIPEYATELCQTLLKSKSLTTDDVVVNTLTDVLFDKIKNDVSYDVDNKNVIVMIEHQSTINYNMPLRMLIYLARQYEKKYRDRRIYKKKRIKINMPFFFVMYNGEEDAKAISTMRLSEAFDCPGYKPTIEMVIAVFNLNKLDQIPRLRDCKILREYSAFISLVREYKKETNDLGGAISLAIDYCIAHNILKDYLKDRGAEVRNMMTMEYNHDLELQATKEEGFEEGMDQGLQRGLDSGIRSSVKMLRSVGTPDTVITTKLMEEFNLTREEALAYM